MLTGVTAMLARSALAAALLGCATRRPPEAAVPSPELKVLLPKSDACRASVTWPASPRPPCPSIRVCAVEPAWTTANGWRAAFETVDQEGPVLVVVLAAGLSPGRVPCAKSDQACDIPDSVQLTRRPGRETPGVVERTYRCELPEHPPLFHDDERRFEPFPLFEVDPRAYVDALSPRERRQFRRACPDRLTDAALADPYWQRAIRCGCAVARGEEEAAVTACARDEE